MCFCLFSRASELKQVEFWRSHYILSSSSIIPPGMTKWIWTNPVSSILEWLKFPEQFCFYLVPGVPLLLSRLLAQVHWLLYVYWRNTKHQPLQEFHSSTTVQTKSFHRRVGPNSISVFKQFLFGIRNHLQSYWTVLDHRLLIADLYLSIHRDFHSGLLQYQMKARLTKIKLNRALVPFSE